MIETSSVLPQKSLATFGNLRKMFGKCSENVRKMFGDVRQAFRTILENLWKVVKNIVISMFI